MKLLRPSIADMPLFSQRHFRGGTLLEIMVSLVLVGLMVGTLYPVLTQGRRIERAAQYQQHDKQAALTWQTARQQGVVWAQGQMGVMPNEAGRWELTELPAMDSTPSGDTPIGPDKSWRLLVLHFTQGSDTRIWQTPVRLPTVIPADPQAVGGV